VDAIAAVVTDDEEVLCILKCVHYDKRGKIAVTLKCSAVVTSKTIYLFREGTFTKGLSAGTESIPPQTLTGISRKRQLGIGTVVELSRAGNIDLLMMCNEEQAEKWVSLAKKVAASASEATSSVTQQVLDPLDQIKKLKELFDAGILTEGEFESKKQSLLDKI
jgi:hypothetical protein